MKPESRKYIKLLKFDAKDASAKAALQTYFPATVLATNYPNLLSENLPALAVRAYLVTYDYNLPDTREHLSQLVRGMCRDYSRLETSGHPKWREVELTMPSLGKGWRYYGPTASEIRACAAEHARSPKPVRRSCTQQEHVLGLCRA
jgi:hypothetical protein